MSSPGTPARTSSPGSPGGASAPVSGFLSTTGRPSIGGPIVSLRYGSETSAQTIATVSVIP